MKSPENSSEKSVTFLCLRKPIDPRGRPTVTAVVITILNQVDCTHDLYFLLLFLGDDRESTGTLLSIDSQEGVVKLDQTGDVKMLQLKYLCKMKAD